MCSYVLVTFRLSKVLNIVPRCFIYEVFILNIFFLLALMLSRPKQLLCDFGGSPSVHIRLSNAWDFSCTLHVVILQSDDHRNTIFMSFLAKSLITYWLKSVTLHFLVQSWKFAHLNSFADWNGQISPPLVWVHFWL